MSGQGAPEFPFEGRVVLLAGAGTPVGRACGAHLRARGATVLAAEAYPEGRGAIDEIRGTVGRLDAVVLCAASRGLDAIDADDSPTRRDWHDLSAIWALAAAAGPDLAAAGAGRIVFVLPGHGVFGAPGASHRMVLHGALTGLVRSLAIDLAGTGVLVNAVAPVLAADLPEGFFARHRHLDPALYAPESVATTVAALAHPTCRLTGTVLSVTGVRVSRVATVTGLGVSTDDARLSELVASPHGPALTAPLEPGSTLEELLLAEV